MTTYKTHLNGYLVFFFGMMLNQSVIMSDLNVSLADIFLVVMFIYMVIRQFSLKIPLKEMSFFIFLSIMLIIVPFVAIPLFLNIDVPDEDIIKGYIKYIVVFLYFLCGYNMHTGDTTKKFLIGFVTGSVVVSFLSILATITNFKPLMALFYPDNTRLQGFMNDPNYFAIIQLIAFGIVVKLQMKPKYKVIFAIPILISIILSGSKTGLISTTLVIIVMFISKIRSAKNYKSISWIIAVGMVTVIMGIAFWTNAEKIASATNTPSLNRLSELNNGFDDALTRNGSERLNVWSNAVDVIKMSPIFGVGSGGYLSVSKQAYGVGNVAHNTYLQIMAEWGVPLALLFFVYLGKNIFHSISRNVDNLYQYRGIVALIVVIFLCGSLAISLNNARLFWVALGIMISYKNAQKMYRLKASESKTKDKIDLVNLKFFKN